MKKENHNTIENLKKIIKEKDNTIDNYKTENKNLLKKIDSMTIDNIKLSNSVKKEKMSDKKDTGISPINFSKKSPIKHSPGKSPSNKKYEEKKQKR